jgi:deazaflavin-dependent oxidoreductase (nitroreductase family)
MSAVAVERGAVPVSTELAEPGTDGAPRVPQEAAPSRLERLALRFMRWTMEHPQAGYPRFILKMSLIGYRLGLWHLDDDMIVTTTGRASGLPRRAVLSVHHIDDRWYTLDPFGERAHWYRNVQADPVVTIQRHGKTWTARGTRLTDRDEALELYEQIPWLRWMLRVHDLPETAEGFADGIEGPVHFVRWDSVDEPGPPPMPSDLAWIWPVAGAAGIVSGLRSGSILHAVGTAAASMAALVTAAIGWGALYGSTTRRRSSRSPATRTASGSRPGPPNSSSAM